MQAWCITEGKAGMINQVKGLAAAMRLSYAHHAIQLRSAWQYLPNGFYPFPHYAIANHQAFCPSRCPPIVITCGKRSVYAALYLKSRLGKRVTTIHIQNPNISSSCFDYVIAPSHDRLSGHNVISSQLALNHIRQSCLDDAAEQLSGHFIMPSRSLTLVILGGTNRHFDFTSSALSRLQSQLMQHIVNDEAYCVIVPSRRTPPSILDELRNWSLSTSYATIWSDGRINPYLGLLAQCDRTIITGDSSSMISESISAKKPTYVFQLPSKRQINRLERFHEHVFNKQWAQPLSFPLKPCHPVSTDETQIIADYLCTQIAIA